MIHNFHNFSYSSSSTLLSLAIQSSVNCEHIRIACWQIVETILCFALCTYCNLHILTLCCAVQEKLNSEDIESPNSLLWTMKSHLAKTSNKYLHANLGYSFWKYHILEFTVLFLGLVSATWILYHLRGYDPTS